MGKCQMRSEKLTSQAYNEGWAKPGYSRQEGNEREDISAPTECHSAHLCPVS